ncbi:MAG: glycosyltransferase family 2 protein, partial [Vicinamibacterales bacterium]
METTGSPLVSVVTPVYNGERYLVECIESVLKQTHANWEYIVNDNCSTDGTAAIVKQYAALDGRIRYYRNEQFVRAIPNHNIALSLISRESRYCKVLQADDWLYPECLDRMVALAEANPSVGVVIAYRLEDRWV